MPAHSSATRWWYCPKLLGLGFLEGAFVQFLIYGVWVAFVLQSYFGLLSRKSINQSLSHKSKVAPSKVENQ